MKFVRVALPLVLAVSAGAAQNPIASQPAKLWPGLGNLHHPITTTNPQAQSYFDQGVTLVYAFNRDEAVRSFQRAADLDPQAPMPWWGRAHPRLYPDWYYPVRESLGAALYRQGQYPEAEKVFRDDLDRNPRSLFGLLTTLKAEKKTVEADWVRCQFEHAWRDADVQLSMEDL